MPSHANAKPKPCQGSFANALPSHVLRLSLPVQPVMPGRAKTSHAEPCHPCRSQSTPVPKRAKPLQWQTQSTPVVVIIAVLVEVEELLLVDPLVLDVLPVDVSVVDVLLEVLVEIEDVLLL
jgi:hypothetical protein